ncbi:hypothetical protein M758_8G021400 [Ceratodon purpureus]|nr:hypothetical protein M758_8G021400 [Ceratodon purpureus]KAG0607343.1 hypothetical protein M758_8G021400 [Ceratodon purpureus]KAG0607347.1 hypothetical protein M758_8G021400 [Ceratodon purpureus]
MANVIRRVVAQRSGVNWSGEEGLGSGISNVTRRLISSQPQAIDVHREGGEVVASVAGAALPWAWSHEAVRGVSQLVAPKGKRLFLVDTLALVRRLESEGLTPKQSEAITAVITEVLNDSLENVGQTFTSIHEMQRSEMMADAALGKFKGQMQSSQV